MRFFLTILAFCILLTPSYALAENMRAEDIATNVMSLIQANDFKAVEKIFDAHRSQNTLSRHGTDMTNTVINEITERIKNERSFTQWKEELEKWALKSPDRFMPNFFQRHLKHYEAWFYQTSDEWDTLQQSRQRKYKAILSGSYTFLYRLNKKYPNEWRGHAYLVENFKKFKLNAKEVNEHYYKANKLKPHEVSNLSGYINSLSPYALGRSDEAIVAGIEKVLRRHPDRNLSKPEYIDKKIEREIEEAIFEYIINDMLLKTRDFVKKAPQNSATPILISNLYKTINHDIKRFYRNDKKKLENHPLSYRNAQVINEIENSYIRLENSFPQSGQYLTERLKIKLDQNQMNLAGEIIKKITKYDPEYAPAKLQPMLCKYHSRIPSNQRKKTTINDMYTTCKNATKYLNEQLFFYRAGWAARQKKDFKTSIELIEKALKFEPTNDTYMTDLCLNYKDLEDYNNALDYCDKAIEENQKNARAWLGRSHIYYYGFKNTDQAKKDAMVYERLIEKSKK